MSLNQLVEDENGKRRYITKVLAQARVATKRVQSLGYYKHIDS